jgi:hypothetical protein
MRSSLLGIEKWSFQVDTQNLSSGLLLVLSGNKISKHGKRSLNFFDRSGNKSRQKSIDALTPQELTNFL